MTQGISVKWSGPLFTEHRVAGAVEQAVIKIVELGQQQLAQRLRKQPRGVYLANGNSQGNYRRNVKTEFQDAYNVLITDGGVVYGPWLEGTSSRNETTRFKGYAVFRTVTEWMQKKADDVVGRIIVKELK